MGLRRYYEPGATVFITQVVRNRQPVFWHRTYLDLLRTTLRRVRELHPFTMEGYVFLPEHFHILIRPTGESNFSQIMHSLKPNFTNAYKQVIKCDGSLRFWQRRFWDHLVRDERDFWNHLDYIHYNPVKHGLVCKPEDWKDSSFLVWKARGLYEDEWGWSEPRSVAQCLATGE